MRTEAAVLVELNKPLELLEIEVPPLQAGQALVEIDYTGICHTQLLECRGHRGHDPYLPHCLGHEGSGVVLEVGAACKKVKPGDRVILSWIKGSGGDVHGSTYRWNGRDVSAGGITTFQRHSLISENRLTPIPGEMPMKEAALIGCAVPTGLGAVFNTARPQPGSSIAIFGTGGVGLCAVAGAAIAGCMPVIAIDVLDSKLVLARRMGATHCLNASRQDLETEVQQLCPGGLDYAVEASGRPAVMAKALESVRHQGGTAVVIGNAHFGEELTINPRQLNMGKRLLGTWGGDSVPDRDYPRYCKLLAAGRLDVAPLLSRTYQFAEINDAMDDLEAGRVGRPIIAVKEN